MHGFEPILAKDPYLDLCYYCIPSRLVDEQVFHESSLR